jgi:hypothetical protein
LAASEQSLGYRVKFDFSLYFSEVFDRKRHGFDIVIGNPPYLNVELVSKADKDYFSSAYKTFYKRFDVFGLFFELGLTRLVPRGTVAFIVPQQIFNNLSYKKLRNMILANKWLHQVLYLGDKIFESANNDVCVLFLWKRGVEQIRLVNALDFDRRITTEVPNDFFEKFDNVISFSADSSADGIFEKMYDSKHELIRNRFDVFQGIVTGNNAAYILSETQVKANSIERKLLHPVLLGRDFEKWSLRNVDRWILYVTGDTDLSSWPKAEAFLLQYKSELKKRRECKRGIIPWYSLQWPRDKAQLDRIPKILVQGTRNPRLKTRLVATMDEEGVYGTQGMNFVVPNVTNAPIYYLLAILNSSLLNYLFATKLLNVAIKAEYIKNTRLPIPDPTTEAELTRLTKKILALKQARPDADVRALEQNIDRLVYGLYGLTAAEIKLVEESTSQRLTIANAAEASA